MSWSPEQIACVEGIAALARATTSAEAAAAYRGERLSFGPEYLIPQPFDPRLMGVVATAVARAAISGVCSAGFTTTVQPTASAGATFQASISKGKFHGITCPQTPCARIVGRSASINCAKPA